MQMTINGRTEEIDVQTIAELVRHKGLSPERLVVELNMNIVRQDRWTHTLLREGDTLELLSFVGGG